MSNENNEITHGQIISKLETIRSLTDECLIMLGEKKRLTKKTERVKPPKTSPPVINFNLNIRHFVKQRAKTLSGPKKFVLILAYLAQGKTDKEVSLNDVEKAWGKMTSKTLLAMEFNRFYPTSAKESGWIDSTKKGFYHLTKSWQQIFASNG